MLIREATGIHMNDAKEMAQIVFDALKAELDKRGIVIKSRREGSALVNRTGNMVLQLAGKHLAKL